MAEKDPAQAPDRPHWELTQRVIGAAFEVHKALGPGFLEKVYVNALLHELREVPLAAQAEVPIAVSYKGAEVGLYYADILVEGKVICEIKAVVSLLREHEAQLLHYLKATETRVGLLLNFGAKSVEVKRMIL